MQVIPTNWVFIDQTAKTSDISKVLLGIHKDKETTIICTGTRWNPYTLRMWKHMWQFRQTESEAKKFRLLLVDQEENQDFFTEKGLLSTLLSD